MRDEIRWAVATAVAAVLCVVCAPIAAAIIAAEGIRGDADGR
jgi:hypothetical protein